MLYDEEENYFDSETTEEDFFESLGLNKNLGYSDYRNYHSSLNTEIDEFSENSSSQIITNPDFSKYIKCNIPDKDWAHFIQYIRLCSHNTRYFKIDKREYIPIKVLYKKRSETEKEYREAILINREARKGKRMCDFDIRDIDSLGLDDDLSEYLENRKNQNTRNNNRLLDYDDDL